MKTSNDNKRFVNRLQTGVRNPGQASPRPLQPQSTHRAQGMIAGVNQQSASKAARAARRSASTASAHDVTAVFRLNAPFARSVKLAGEFTDWEKLALNMKQDRNGVWEIAVSLAPGRHFYRFLVDGQWQDDPQCARSEPNPFGTTDAVIEVR